MNKLKLFEAMNLIDDDLVKEASEDNVKPAADSSADKSITVSGVERYHRIAWHRLAAVASAVLLIAGLGAGGALMLKRRPPLLEETAESTTAEATAVTEIKVEVSTEKNGSSSEKEVPTDEEKTKESNDITAPSEDKQTDTEETTAAPQEEDGAAMTTAVTTIQWKTSPANASTLPKPTTVTTAEVHYPDEKTSEPAAASDVFRMLDSLNYHAISCDGLPEYKLTAPDGTVYLLNFNEGWVWRRPSLIAEADNEAPLTQEVINAIYANWNDLNIAESSRLN